jgi:hypothetical protein
MDYVNLENRPIIMFLTEDGNGLSGIREGMLAVHGAPDINHHRTTQHNANSIV